jgi:hypothetical protein
VYQLEVDPVAHPQMATGAELIGTLVYHALGYFVEDVYLIRVDPGSRSPRRQRSATPRVSAASAGGTWRPSCGRARATGRGRVYLSATRFHEGEDIGEFEYYGTRSDDPNDIHPHEHRRELRANRIFCAWLAHDDSLGSRRLHAGHHSGGQQASHELCPGPNDGARFR